MGKFNTFTPNLKSRKINLVWFSVIAFGTFILLSFIVIKWIFPMLQGLSVANIIAILALLVTTFSLVFTIGKYIYEYQLSAKSNIQLSVSVVGKNAIIKCSIENNGQKRFVPQNVYVFVEKGLENNTSKLVEFPILLKHEKDECDCILSKKCKQGGVEAYTSEMITEERKDLYHKVFKFQHLSHETIMYIDPGEEFKDSIVISLDKGVYRVMAIATIVKGDCICSTENFVII